jgi:hypothetical protein
MGRIGIKRIESMRRVLPHTAMAAKLCADRKLDDTATHARCVRLRAEGGNRKSRSRPRIRAL